MGASLLALAKSIYYNIDQARFQAWQTSCLFPNEQKRNGIYGYPQMKIAEILTKINPTEEMQVRIKTYEWTVRIWAKVLMNVYEKVSLLRT